MNKKLGIIGIVVILICVGLSGCNKPEDKKEATHKPIGIVIEAIAQVVNSTGKPLEGVSVTFEFSVYGTLENTLVRTTDSTGWTSFAVHSTSIPEVIQFATCNIYLTENKNIREYLIKYYLDIKDKTVNNVYYWSISSRLVKE